MTNMLVDLHVHAMAHGEYEHTYENLRLFMKAAAAADIQVLGFAEHDWFVERFNPQVIYETALDHPEIKILMGMELDHRIGGYNDAAEKTSRYPFDYVIGSVHEIGTWMFDHPNYTETFCEWNIDELYAEYFSLVEDMALSGLYDVVGHLDLIKVFGHRPVGDIRNFAEEALLLIKKKDMVVEVNTSGKYKPAGEAYPSTQLLVRCLSLGVPITLGSDAHRPAHVGRTLKDSVVELKEIGFREVVYFNQRRPVTCVLD